MSEAARIRSLEQQNAALRESVDILKEEVLLHKNAFPDAQWLPDDALKMPLKEISVCRAFLRRRTPTAEYIYNTLYGLHECDIALNSVQTHISKLRKKLHPFGISIDARRNSHYVMSQVDVEMLRSLSDLSKVRLPK
ncbi:MAG: hypothetical protein COB78_05805 [Hyphomicrobiales bacterium]|nr:MAG: hypothetical protein COB78_05805 [Hyphomicrobiales bacterium]